MSPTPAHEPDTPPGAADPPTVEQRLRRAYQELSFHVENTPLAVIEWDRGVHVTRWSGQAERMFGWSADEVIGKAVTDWRFVYEADRPAVEQLVREMTTGRSIILNRNYTKSGAVIWSRWHNSVLQDEAGQVVSVLSLVLDITEQKAAEEALARSEAGLRAALSSARMIGWERDLTTERVLYSSDPAAFFGAPADRDYTTSENARALVHPNDLAAVERATRRSLEACGELSYEFRGRVPRADGETRWFTIRGQALAGPDGKPARVVGVTTDVTDRKRAERERAALDGQLLDAQKWESLGVLAGGVAHDFNNILTVILGGAGLARRALPAGSPAAPLLDQIEDASRRAADLCRQMLVYAGRGPAATGRADLNQLIRDAASLLGVPAARHARVRYDLAADLPPTQVDAAQARQVLVSLVMNAAEALAESGGEVVVRTRQEAVIDPDPAGYRLPPAPGRYAVLEVSDTGPGMTDEVKARMFDPFFTTRFAGRGLGLSAVLGIVKGHGGAIAVQTAPGRGTTVRVLWPVDPAANHTPAPAPAAAPPTPAAQPSSPAAPRSRGIALVVDDEMFVREVAASTLEDLGYEAVLGGDGPAGVELFRRHRGSVRVVVIDVVMPGMTGEQVVEAMRADEPDLPVVLISGYTDRHPTGPRIEFLHKPFHPEDLTAAVLRVTGTDTDG
jgi:PAS domain S-box-containing protein